MDQFNRAETQAPLTNDRDIGTTHFANKLPHHRVENKQDSNLPLAKKTDETGCLAELLGFGSLFDLCSSTCRIELLPTETDLFYCFYNNPTQL